LEKHIGNLQDASSSGKGTPFSKAPSISDDETTESEWREGSSQPPNAIEKPCQSRSDLLSVFPRLTPGLCSTAWIVHMANKTKDTTIDALKRTSSVAGAAPLNPGAIGMLNSAIEDLQNFKLKRAVTAAETNNIEIPLQLAEEWIEGELPLIRSIDFPTYNSSFTLAIRC